MQLRSELDNLTQTGTLSRYFDHLEILRQRINLNLETKLRQFVNGIKPYLKEALPLRQPSNYDTAIYYAKRKNSTSTNNYDRLLEQIKQLTQTNTGQELPVNNLYYPDSAKLSQGKAKLKTRIKQLEREKISIYLSVCLSI